MRSAPTAPLAPRLLPNAAITLVRRLVDGVIACLGVKVCRHAAQCRGARRVYEAAGYTLDMDLLDACIQTRNICAQALLEALRELLGAREPISETAVAARLLSRLRQHGTLYPDGWYMPPPHGLFVQFGTDEVPGRVNQTTNRVAGAWPRPDSYLDREKGILSAYASPVDRETGMIGDFGITLYFGRKREIHDMIHKTLAIDRAVFEKLTVGMPLSRVATLALEQIRVAGFSNSIVSLNDTQGTNIGHTLPASDTGWDAAEQGIISGSDWQRAVEVISAKRLFINTTERAEIVPNMAHTLEPRPMIPDRPDLPMINLHTIVIWRGGTKKWVCGFEDLFALAGMDAPVDI